MNPAGAGSDRPWKGKENEKADSCRSRIGFCLDVGWEFCCGRDVAETIRTYRDRIYDIHLKNFAVDIPGGQVLSKEVPRSFTTASVRLATPSFSKMTVKCLRTPHLQHDGG